MADDHHGLILPGDRSEPAKPDKPYVPLHSGRSTAAKITVSLPGAVEVVAEDVILVPDAGEWMLVEMPLWAKMVSDLAAANVALEQKRVSKRAIRIQRRRDQRN